MTSPPVNDILANVIVYLRNTSRRKELESQATDRVGETFDVAEWNVANSGGRLPMAG